MQIVIDIPDIMYKSVCDGTYKHWKSFQAVVERGAVLPEKHGRLIDADGLIKFVIDDNGKIKAIEAPTIIEADKEN